MCRCCRLFFRHRLPLDLNDRRLQALLSAPLDRLQDPSSSLVALLPLVLVLVPRLARLRDQWHPSRWSNSVISRALVPRVARRRAGSRRLSCGRRKHGKSSRSITRNVCRQSGCYGRR